MDPLASTSEDAGASTSTKSSLRHMPSHDVTAFGVSCDLSTLYLPTKKDILKYYFFLSERAKNQSKMFSYKSFSPHVTDRLIEIWSQLDIKILTRNTIQRKLDNLLHTYQTKNKMKSKSPSSYTAFIQSINELFHIGKCKCDLKTALCSCGLIPERLKEFMLEQNNDRELTILEFMTEIEEQAPTV